MDRRFSKTKSGRPADGSRHVDRAEFDKIALDHARSLGTIVLEEATALSAVKVNDKVVTYRHQGEEHTQQTRFLIDASGQARLLARWWKLPVSRHHDLNNYAMYGYWSGSSVAETEWRLRGMERWATISACEKGWVWHIPIKPDVVSVGWVSNKTVKKKRSEKRIL